LRCLDDLRIPQHRLERPDPSLHEPLLVLRGVVLRVLADVAVLARDLQPLGDPDPAVTREIVELRPHPEVGVEREGGRRVLSGLAGGPIAELFGEFSHAFRSLPTCANPAPAGPPRPVSHSWLK